MTAPTTGRPAESRAEPTPFPWAALLALAASGLLAIVTETIPAGLLPEVAIGLGVSESAAGQFVTLYAVGSVVAAIPLVAATRSISRRKVLLAAVVTLLVFNTVTAVAPWYALILVARVIAGAAAALVWGVLAGYARRLVAPHLVDAVAAGVDRAGADGGRAGRGGDGGSRVPARPAGRGRRAVDPVTRLRGPTKTNTARPMQVGRCSLVPP